MAYKYDSINGELVELTAEQIAELEAKEVEWNNGSADRKLNLIKEIRLEKLQETDWWVISEQITDTQKTWRQNLRNIPADYDSSKYDELLNRNDQGQLTHSIWEKP